MKVLDLFAGTGSSTAAFVDRKHDVIHVELDPTHGWGSIDAKSFAKRPYEYLPTGWKPDVIWASPPCTAFSMGGKGSKDPKSPKNEILPRWLYQGPYPFYGPRKPNDEVARLGCALVLSTLEVIRKLEPSYYWIENPMGGLKTMTFMKDVPGPAIVTYCQYGDFRQKATTLWGVWPETWTPRPRCKNGDKCHEASPRGSKTGTQSLKKKERSMVPYALSESIAIACEKALEGKGV